MMIFSLWVSIATLYAFNYTHIKNQHCNFVGWTEILRTNKYISLNKSLIPPENPKNGPYLVSALQITNNNSEPRAFRPILKISKIFAQKSQTPPIFHGKGGEGGGSYDTPIESSILAICRKLSTKIVSRPWVKLQAVKVGSSNRKSRFFGFAVYVQMRPKWGSDAPKF